MLSILVLIDYLVLPLLLIFIGYRVYSRFKDRLVDYIVMIITAGFVSEGLKYFINSPRPDTLLTFEGASFPSTHTTIAFAAAFFYVLVCHTSKTGVGKAKIKIGEWVAMIVVLLLAVLVSFLRITLGAHYLVDIIAGIILGFLISFPFVYYDLTLRRIR